MRAIFVDWRVGRIIMFIMITGSVAYGFGSSLLNVLLASILGATMSASGFYLDYLGDYKRDKESGKISNPIAKGVISPKSMAIIIVILLSANMLIAVLINILILIPISCIIFVILGLNYGFLNTPLLRAFSLGVLQGLYVVIGALTARIFDLSVVFVATFLFFAMTGGRVLGDARDFLHDQKIDTVTIPKKYGLKWGSYFLLVNEILAYIFAVLSYFIGDFNLGYFICVVLIIIFGLPITLVFVRNPTPKTGNLVNMLSFGFLGMLFIIGMVLGKI